MVPAAASTTIVITNICIAIGGTVSANIVNGFIDIIFLKVSSIVELNNQQAKLIIIHNTAGI